ncbi:hypothetical protein ACIPK7_19780 [Pseudomonas sp. NPDC086581]|uniref:hypothetical protein n=1 Tax=Pseudomonas sp. NPDC086581 TaxID=3364432 RepID=UPI0037F598BA
MFVTHRHGEIFLGNPAKDDSVQAWPYVEFGLNAPLLIMQVIRAIGRARYKSAVMMTSVSDLKKAIFEEGPCFQIESLSVATLSRLNGTEYLGMERLDEVLQVSDAVTNRSGVMLKTASGKKYFSEQGEWSEPLRVDKHIYKSSWRSPQR